MVCKCFQTKKNATKKLFLDFGLFLPFYDQKTAKIDQQWRKLAKSKLFGETFWNLVCRCFSSKKMLQKNFFWISAFFCRFMTKKQPKLTNNEENWQNSNRLMKIFWNLVCRCFSTKKMLPLFFVWISAFFGRFLAKKQPKLT